MSQARHATFLRAACHWAAGRPDIRALVLVGSHARGEAHADSDVDLVLMTTAMQLYVDDTSWTQLFGAVDRVDVEAYPPTISVRVLYLDGLEVEFGVAPIDWLEYAGTESVWRDGFRILLDPDGAATAFGASLRPV